MKLFGNTIDPSCSYCEYGKLSADDQIVLCEKYGPVSPFYHCRKYLYSPLKRKPRKNPTLPKFDPADFSI
jgi:hypothetical protein